METPNRSRRHRQFYSTIHMSIYQIYSPLKHDRKKCGYRCKLIIVKKIACFKGLYQIGLSISWKACFRLFISWKYFFPSFNTLLDIIYCCTLVTILDVKQSLKMHNIILSGWKHCWSKITMLLITDFIGSSTIWLFSSVALFPTPCHLLFHHETTSEFIVFLYLSND